MGQGYFPMLSFKVRISPCIPTYFSISKWPHSKAVSGATQPPSAPLPLTLTSGHLQQKPQEWPMPVSQLKWVVPGGLFSWLTSCSIMMALQFGPQENTERAWRPWTLCGPTWLPVERWVCKLGYVSQFSICARISTSSATSWCWDSGGADLSLTGSLMFGLSGMVAHCKRMANYK